MNDDNELRTVIADLMDEHRHCCLRKSADMTDSILAAIRERHAIVRLPEPTSSGPVSTSWGLVTKWDRMRQTPGERRLVTIDPHDRGMTPESARALAAALLAAADAAEREQ